MALYFGTTYIFRTPFECFDGFCCSLHLMSTIWLRVEWKEGAFAWRKWAVSAVVTHIHYNTFNAFRVWLTIITTHSRWSPKRVILQSMFIQFFKAGQRCSTWNWWCFRRVFQRRSCETSFEDCTPTRIGRTRKAFTNSSEQFVTIQSGRCFKETKRGWNREESWGLTGWWAVDLNARVWFL